MTKYLRLDTRGMGLLWQEAIRRGMVFESPNSVLRDILLRGVESKPRPKDMQIRVDDEVWEKIRIEAARSGMNPNQLRSRDKNILLARLILERGGLQSATSRTPDERTRAKRR